MPDVKVYIRTENLDKWNNIYNKSEWINTLLKNSNNTLEYGETKDTPIRPITTVLSEEVPSLKDLERACCLGKKPCKHWQWDEDNQNWVNSISGRIRVE